MRKPQAKLNLVAKVEIKKEYEEASDEKGVETRGLKRLEGKAEAELNSVAEVEIKKEYEEWSGEKGVRTQTMSVETRGLKRRREAEEAKKKEYEDVNEKEMMELGEEERLMIFHKSVKNIMKFGSEVYPIDESDISLMKKMKLFAKWALRVYNYQKITYYKGARFERGYMCNGSYGRRNFIISLSCVKRMIPGAKRFQLQAYLRDSMYLRSTNRVVVVYVRVEQKYVIENRPPPSFINAMIHRYHIEYDFHKNIPIPVYDSDDTDDMWDCNHA